MWIHCFWGNTNSSSKILHCKFKKSTIKVPYVIPLMPTTGGRTFLRGRITQTRVWLPH